MDESRYVEALLKDLDSELAIAGKRQLQSIFFGGGTPSLFSASAIERIIRAITDKLSYNKNLEITLEANPGTFEQEKFSAYRSAGVNRLSIGIQSFDNQCLQKLGRIHNAEQARSAVETAQQSGFDNINLDLMYALPQQSLAQARNDVQLACELGIQHVSHYQLTLEPNTYFHSHPPALPDNELAWNMQQVCHEILSQQGLQQYEVSAFALDQHRCRHNLNYWQFGDYIGIGAGAHGKLTQLTPELLIQRRWKRRQPEDYMRHCYTESLVNTTDTELSGIKTLPADEIIFEFLLNALRLKQGCSYQLFEQHTGFTRQQLISACQKIDPELLVVGKSNIRASEHGYRYLDGILQQFL